jgi:hypothetical protein
VEQLPKFDVTAFDKLEDYTLALSYANAQYLTANQPADDLDAVTTEGTALRETLLMDATALSRRGFIDGNRLKDLNGTRGLAPGNPLVGARPAWLRQPQGARRFRRSVRLLAAAPREPADEASARRIDETSACIRRGSRGCNANPMDLDYRALSNAGLWCVGRLQTDGDRTRVLDGLSASIEDGADERAELAHTVQRLAPRWFVVRNAHAASRPLL